VGKSDDNQWFLECGGVNSPSESGGKRRRERQPALYFSHRGCRHTCGSSSSARVLVSVAESVGELPPNNPIPSLIICCSVWSFPRGYIPCLSIG